MKMSATVSMLGLVAGCGIAAAEEKAPSPYPTMAPIEQYRMTAQDEIALARSAAPASISADAAVLVMGAHGYEIAAKGKNGWVCFVERSWTADFDDPGFWNPKIRGPNCFNPPAVRSVLPQYEKRTQWFLAGSSREQALAKARAAYAHHEFTNPAPGSFSFMLSKQGYLGDEAGGPWRPHVMFFVAHGETAAWGVGAEGSPVLGEEGGAFEPTVLFIPVPRWSDGSPAELPGEHKH